MTVLDRSRLGFAARRWLARRTSLLEHIAPETRCSLVSRGAQGLVASIDHLQRIDIVIEVETPDAVCPAACTARLDVIEIDVEGAELQVPVGDGVSSSATGLPS